MKKKTELSENLPEKRHLKKPISSTVLFIIIALSVAFGFIAGNYKYQIMSAIGPVFGYKSHSGSLDISSLQETYNTLASSFDGNLDTQSLIDGANRGMVAAAGDDYTIYMSPKEVTEFNNSLTGNIGGGIGAEIGIKNEKIVIIRPLKDNPAEKSGLHADDIILAINDQSTDSFTVDKAVGLIRGDAGTTVKLAIQRGSEIKEFTITRAIINNPSVDSSVSDGVGVLTITRFDEKTGGLARTAAQGFIKQNVKAIVLDLRGNGGGYVDAAQEVAGLWLNNKTVMTEKVGSMIRDVITTGNEALLGNIPTVVLINGGSASASEIVAGALRDNIGAKLIGEKTFGKGSMQQLNTLSGGAQLKVTIAKWYTPNDINVNKNGLDPDMIVKLTQADIDKGIDTQLDTAKKALGV